MLVAGRWAKHVDDGVGCQLIVRVRVNVGVGRTPLEAHSATSNRSVS